MGERKVSQENGRLLDDTDDAPASPKAQEPIDRFKIVYWIMVLMGVGTLLPWNMFITAHAYFTTKLKSESTLQHDFESYFAIAAMVPNVLMFFFNTLFKHKVPLNVRMLSSLILITILFVVTTALVKVDTSTWTARFFYITIITVIVVNMVTAVFQGGLFGLTGMMPAKYTGAVMTGQGIGGTFAAVANILSIWGGKDAISSGFGYFLSAVVLLFLCLICYIVLPTIKFARHYLGERQRQQLDVTSIQGQSKRLANWDIERKPGNSNSSLSLDANARTYLGAELESKEMHFKKTETPPFVMIFKRIAPVGLSVAFVFFVTLSAFPALTSKVQSQNQDKSDDWTSIYFIPVTCFLLFNVGDFLGRLAATFIQFPHSGSKLLPILCFLRVVFLPLLFFCNAQPRSVPMLFDNDAYFITFMALFAISNGYLGSLCMMYGPGLVEPKHAETAGNMMAFMLVIGLGSGAAFSFALTACLKL